MRDAALTMRTILRVNGSQLHVNDNGHVFHYVDWVLRAQAASDPHQMDVRIEPKFNLPNGGVYGGPWCRPQTDGPALRATTLMMLAELVANSAAGRSFVKRKLWTQSTALHGGAIAYDLDWVAKHWQSTASCDLWEEIRAPHLFWNVAAFTTALQLGTVFASQQGDNARSALYASEAKKAAAMLASHYNGQYLYETKQNGRQLDSAVIGALRNAYMFAPRVTLPFGNAASLQVAQTVQAQVDYFCNAFQINQQMASEPGILIGRYVGDHYVGGNPWILSTAQLGGLLFEASSALKRNGTVDSAALAVWNDVLDPSLHASTAAQLAASLSSAASGVLERLEKLTSPYEYQLSEQLSRDTGAELSATNLTWSYASVLEATLTQTRYFASA